MSSTSARLAIALSTVFCLIGAAAAQQRVPDQPVRTSTPEELDESAPAQEAIATPAQPQQHGDPGGGGQGRQTLKVGGLPDLALIGNLQLANAAIPWGTAAAVAATDAAYTKHGRCAFRYKYVTRNQGMAGAGASSNRIRRDDPTGPVIANDALPPLAQGATAISDGHVLLVPGTWMLYMHVDDPKAVAESNETNNLRRVRVTVKGKCKKQALAVPVH